MCYVYWFSFVQKSYDVWHSEASAVHYALQLDIFVTPVGKFLSQYPDLLAFFSRSVYWLELFGPLAAMPARFSPPGLISLWPRSEASKRAKSSLSLSESTSTMTMKT